MTLFFICLNHPESPADFCEGFHRTVQVVSGGDLDGDGVVNGADLGIMLADWEGGASSPADLNDDGRVDGLDLGVLLANWTA